MDAALPPATVNDGKNIATIVCFRNESFEAGLRARRVEWRFAATQAPSSSPDAELHTGVSLDDLFRGWNWESGWYAGLGAGPLGSDTHPCLAGDSGADQP